VRTARQGWSIARAPRRPGNAIAAEVADAILALRRARPHWGPKKLKAVLAQRQPAQAWPAASTIGDLLQRRTWSERPGGGGHQMTSAMPAPVAG
jgi:hypothetical protein